MPHQGVVVVVATTIMFLSVTIATSRGVPARALVAAPAFAHRCRPYGAVRRVVVVPQPYFPRTRTFTVVASHKNDDDDDDDATILVEESDDDDDVPPPRRRTQAELAAELRRYRLARSTPLKKPPYSVFTNAALDGICRTLPTTATELLAVKGIGPKKLAEFGDDILDLVAVHVGEARVVVPRTVPSRKLLARDSLTPEQRRAADVPLESDHNVFITGAAGTGKSFVLEYILQELRIRQVKVGVCAPTGVAAINVGGSTLHSFFGIGLGVGNLNNLITKVTKNKEAKKRIDQTDVLCIDECSMLSSDLLETLDAIVREVRMEGAFRDEPFGGMRLVAVGDFFQLPPIPNKDDDNDDPGRRPFCFDSFVWSELGLTEHKIELKDVQRQDNDSKFVQFLNMVRVGRLSQGILDDFNAKCLTDAVRHPLPTDGIVPTKLYVLNRDVDKENETRLAGLTTKEFVCRARNEWRELMPDGTSAADKKRMQDGLAKEMPDELRLKVGAQVMLTRNRDLQRGLVNGSRGVVEALLKNDDDGADLPIPLVRFDNGVVEKVTPAEAVRYNPDPAQKTGCLVRKQIPLKLAWALTVHKSQGTTLTRASLDISSAFEYGQCYVALSRIRDIDGLWLEKPARLSNIMVSPQVIDYYESII